MKKNTNYLLPLFGSVALSINANAQAIEDCSELFITEIIFENLY